MVRFYRVSQATFLIPAGVPVLLGSPLNPFETQGKFEIVYSGSVERKQTETDASQPKPARPSPAAVASTATGDPRAFA